MKKTVTMAAAVVISVLTCCLMLAHGALSRNESGRERESALLLATRIHDSVVARLMKPVTVAQTMACDDFLIDFLRNESVDVKGDEARMMAYLGRIQQEFGYASACVISEATRRYYRNDEMHKIVHPESDPHDVWYANFADGGADFYIGVYRNATSTADSTFYLNASVKDADGTFLGVVSTGLYVRDVISLFASFERQYGIKIDMADETGLVVLDSNFADINTASLAHLVSAREPPSQEFRYLRYGMTGFAVTKFVDELGWYFVLRSDHRSAALPSQLFYLVAVALWAASLHALYVAQKKLQRKQRNRFLGKVSQVDALTGLPNRNFFKDMYGERGVFNTTRYRCLAVFDIDFFKEANDSMNGDEALVSVVANMLRLLDNRGMVLRWGGDEFLVLFELPIESAYAICRQFCKNVEAEHLVTVSVGLTEVRLSDTIKKNYYRAAQCCYMVKEMGGNGVKKS